MAKKSIIAGEYHIQIEADGHVDVLRIPRNTMGALREIANEKEFAIEDKWNTQDLGRHLVKEFGDGTSAKFGPVTITRMPDNKIEVVEEAPSVIAALRSIAEKVGFSYDSGWNTQLFGSKLVDYLTEHKAEADKILQTPNAKRKDVGFVEEKSTGKDDDAPIKKYILEIEARTIRVDALEFKDADDEQIQYGYEDEVEWTDIVKNTDNLSMTAENMKEFPEDFDDEEALDTLKGMIGDSTCCVSPYMADCDMPITIRVKDEDGNEIETIDGDDVCMNMFEYGYFNADLLDETDEEEMIKKRFIERYPEYKSTGPLKLNMNKPDTWYWMNIQRCTMDENLSYEIAVKGDFDSSKLTFFTVLVEEWCCGIESFQGVAAITYDGQLAKSCDLESAQEENGTNLFMKMDSDGERPVIIYNFTTNESTIY